jgi:monoamine oxidase
MCEELRSRGRLREGAVLRAALVDAWGVTSIEICRCALQRLFKAMDSARNSKGGWMTRSITLCDHPRVRTGSHGDSPVAVLGAGVAGLVAAYELNALGYDVDVYEASPRVGGRIHTHRFGSGPSAPYVELGAMRIPTKHRHAMRYIARLGLGDRVRPFRTLLSEAGNYLSSGSGPVRLSEAMPALVGALQRRLPGSRYRETSLRFAAFLTLVVEAVAPVYMRGQLLGNPMQIGRLVDRLDGMDLRPYLGEPGRSARLAEFFVDNPGFRSLLPPGLDGFIDDIVTETSADLVRLDGGMDALPRRLADALTGGVCVDHEVVGIRARRRDVVIELVHANRTIVRRYDYALCAIPFSALRHIRLSDFGSDKLSVVRKIEYCPATKVAFYCREPFWRDDGISGGASFTGGGIRQTYYPDNGSVLLASYTIGEEADRLGRMLPADRHEYVRQQLATVHPRILEPGMVRAAVSMAWGQDEWVRGGCTVRWGKDDGEVAEEVDLAATPQNHLFFAGEHCSKNPAWIDGAIESALEAVAGIDADVTRSYPVRRSA